MIDWGTGILGAALVAIVSGVVGRELGENKLTKYLTKSEHTSLCTIQVLQMKAHMTAVKDEIIEEIKNGREKR